MNLHYKLEGSGKTLLFIHGLSDSLEYWEVLTSTLRKNYQVLRIDLRGHGKSELGNEEITMDTYVDDIYGLLNELNINDVNLIGFSLGGAIAIDFTLKYPQMVSSLVLMSSFCKADEYSRNIMNQFKRTLSNGFEEFFDYILPLILCPDVIEENRNELECLKEISSPAANTEAYIKAVEVSLNVNSEDGLSRIDVPALVIAGKYDEVFMLETQKDLQGKIRNSELIVFDDVKHNILIGENIKKTLDILNKFYKK